MMQQPTGDFPHVALLEMGKAQWRVLTSLGHVFDRFLIARKLLLKRVAKGGRFDTLKPWLGNDFTHDETKLLDDGGCFVSVLRWKMHRLRVEQMFLHEEEFDTLRPHFPKLPPVLEIPPDTEAPLWPALLRLRPLREFWELELRRNHFETLLSVMPDAWVLDPAPVPHGAVIPRLDLAGWEDLQKLRAQGHSFSISQTRSREPSSLLDATLPVEGWHGAVREALISFGTSPRVLTERDSSSDAMSLFALYEKRADRVSLLGALALTHMDGHPRIARVVSM